eukprot:scaffold109656_cov63-Attheya_sp.AAC.1
MILSECLRRIRDLDFLRDVGTFMPIRIAVVPVVPFQKSVVMDLYGRGVFPNAFEKYGIRISYEMLVPLCLRYVVDSPDDTVQFVLVVPGLLRQKTVRRQ